MTLIDPVVPSAISTKATTTPIGQHLAQAAAAAAEPPTIPTAPTMSQPTTNPHPSKTSINNKSMCSAPRPTNNTKHTTIQPHPKAAAHAWILQPDAHAIQSSISTPDSWSVKKNSLHAFLHQA